MKLQKKIWKKFLLNYLKENKYLSLFDSVNEIYEEIINILKSKLEEVKIKEDKNILIKNSYRRFQNKRDFIKFIWKRKR